MEAFLCGSCGPSERPVPTLCDSRIAPTAGDGLPPRYTPGNDGKAVIDIRKTVLPINGAARQVLFKEYSIILTLQEYVTILNCNIEVYDLRGSYSRLSFDSQLTIFRKLE